MLKQLEYILVLPLLSCALGFALRIGAEARTQRLSIDFESLDSAPFASPLAATSPLDATKRAHDDLWSKSQCKGSKFLTQMSYSDYDVGQSLPVPASTAQSPWNFADLEPWGYFYRPAHLIYRRFDSGWYWGIAQHYRSIGVSDKCTEDGGQWCCKVIYHYNNQSMAGIPEQTYHGPDGKEQRMTGGHFYMAVNPEGGLMTQNRLGPRESVKNVFRSEVFPEDELPQLQKSSDLLWAMWEKEIPLEKRQNVQFFATLSITNPTTLQVMKRAMGSRGIDAAGVNFSMTTEEGTALLGTPNAAAFAHFLIQRKAQVGLKRITDWSRVILMLYEVKKLDTPIPRPNVEDKSDTKPANPDLNGPLEGRRASTSTISALEPGKVFVLGQERNIVRVHTMSGS